MSDILIKGIEMPKKYGYLCITIWPDGKVSKPMDLDCTSIARAVELPEHGNLVDQDELYELVKQRGKNWVGEWCDFECHISGNDIKNAPVVIPSNKEEAE